MTTSLHRHLRELGLELPQVAAPVAAYRPAVRVGGLVLTSGQVPFVDGTLPVTGLVGAEVDRDQAQEQARVCALNCLAAAASVVRGDEEIQQIVRVGVYVASATGFADQATVADGASTLLEQLFPTGHARSAVGVKELPLHAPVEVEVVALAG